MKPVYWLRAMEYTVGYGSFFSSIKEVIRLADYLWGDITVGDTWWPAELLSCDVPDLPIVVFNNFMFPITRFLPVFRNGQLVATVWEGHESL